MLRNRVALALLVFAALTATGCGSDDTEPSSDKPAGAGRAESAAPKSKSHRARMVDCIERELGFEVTPGDDDPHNLSIKSSKGKLKAAVVIHPDADAAASAVVRTQNKGVDAVPFGRAELIRRAASDTETGVIADCVSGEYNRPGR